MEATQNTVLYALSTVAQTCAALAALVGALALYRLQLLRDAHTAVERRIRGLLVPAILSQAMDSPLDEVLRTARANATPDRGAPQRVSQGLAAALREWDRFPAIYTQALRWLVIFEGANLAVVLGSLVGFTCVPWLASHWWVFVALLALGSVGSVAVTALALQSIVRSDST